MAGFDLGLNLNPLKASNLNLGVNLDLDQKQRKQRAPWRQVLPDEQEQSLTSKALGVGASGLGYVAGTLDKPGQAVRGLLAGKGIGSLKHLVPFADSLGLVGEKDHTSGRDLTDKAGLTEKHDKGWGAWGAGLAADMLTDPLSFTTFGPKHALTAAGQLAKKSGALKSLSGAEHIAQGHSGLIGLGLPFQQPSAVLGTGKTAQKVAGALDATGHAIRFGNPIGRAVGAAFDPSVGGAVDKITQLGFQKHGDPIAQAEQQIARDHQAALLQKLDPLITESRHPEAMITQATRTLAEASPTVKRYGLPLIKKVEPAAHQIIDRNNTIASQIREAGGPLEYLDDEHVNYVHRQALNASHKNLQMAERGGNYPVASGSNFHRDELYHGIPGGTDQINQWYSTHAGNTNKMQVARDMLRDIVNNARAGKVMIDKPRANALKDKAKALADRIGSASTVYKNGGVNGGPLDFFTPDLVRDEMQRNAQHVKALTSTKAALGTITDNARPFVNDGTMVSVPDLMDRLGLRTYRANLDASAVTPNAATGPIGNPSTIGIGGRAQGQLPGPPGSIANFNEPMQGALVQAHKALDAIHGLPAADLMGKVKDLRAIVGQYGLTQEHAEQIAKAYGKWVAPEQIKAPLAAFDSMTNLFKSLAYPIWIPSHVRNAVTAAMNNARSGTGWGDYRAAHGIMNGSVDPATLARYGLSNVDEARRKAYATANIFGGHDPSSDALTALTTPGGARFTPSAPGSDRAGYLKETLAGIPVGWGKTAVAAGKVATSHPRNWKQAIADNLGIKGVFGATKDTLPAVEAGRKTGTNIEDLMRMSQWLGQLRQGHTPESAADAVNALHFDYGRLTDFEKNVAKRLLPFYTYARKNLPLQLDTVAHTPVWAQAQTKPFNQPSDDKGYVPDYLRSGVAVPLGPERDGQRRYISKLGLPMEEAFERLHFQNGLPDVRRTALDYMGQLNPLIKGPMEQLFDTQFHTQRNLSDLHAPAAASAIGRLFGDDNPQLLSQVLANTPLTRFVTSADKLFDNRKGWLPKATNLLTGVRVTDVDVDKQRAIDARNALETLLRGQPNLSKYTSFYVKPDQAANLTPEEMELMRLYSTYQQNARDYTKEQKKIGIRQK